MGDYRARRSGLTKKIAETNPAEPVEDNGDAPSEWAGAAWDKAKGAGMMDGTRHGDNLTRQELAVVLKKLNLV